MIHDSNLAVWIQWSGRDTEENFQFVIYLSEIEWNHFCTVNLIALIHWIKLRTTFRRPFSFIYTACVCGVLYAILK